jgi:mycofactocin precursor
MPVNNQPTIEVPPATTTTSDGEPAAGQRVEETPVEETLVEEISIDGMCGVY